MKCDNPFSIKLTPEMAAKHGINHAPVPCGKCLNCKEKRIEQWAFRLLKEFEVSTSAYFVTLTYDNMHVPLTIGRYPMTLLKNSRQDWELREREITDDVDAMKEIMERTDRSAQAFFKRLRYYEKENRYLFDKQIKKVVEQKPIKYYACGEYGSNRKRPHIHIILFNCVSTQSIVSAWATAVVKKGVTVDYTPFGSVDIDPDVNANNIRYVLKYICKDGTVGKAANDFRVPEFSLMSKGLGKNFMTPEIEQFYNQRLDINYVISDNGIKLAMPKYYVNKMMTEETKEDRIGYIKRGVEEMEAKDKTTEAMKQKYKFGRQARKKNYSQRNID